MVTTLTHKAEASKEARMNQLEAKVRRLVVTNVEKPADCVKTEVIFYDKGTGRINLWHRIENNANLDILSYYIKYDNSQIQILSDKEVVYELNF